MISIRAKRGFPLGPRVEDSEKAAAREAGADQLRMTAAAARTGCSCSSRDGDVEAAAQALGCGAQRLRSLGVCSCGEGAAPGACAGEPAPAQPHVRSDLPSSHPISPRGSHVGPRLSSQVFQEKLSSFNLRDCYWM